MTVSLLAFHGILVDFRHTDVLVCLDHGEFPLWVRQGFHDVFYAQKERPKGVNKKLG